MILTPAAKMFEEVAIYMLITTKSAAASCMGQDRMRFGYPCSARAFRSLINNVFLKHW